MAASAQTGGRFRRDELKLRLALRAAKIGIWDWDIATNEMDYSARARSICGFHPGQPITIEMAREITHPDDHPRTAALARRALDPTVRAQEPYRYRIIRADTQEVRWVEAHGEVIFSGAGSAAKALRYVGTLEDITERVQEEERRDKEATRLQLAIEASGMAVWEFDVVTQQVTTSPELNALYGFAASDTPTIEQFRARYLPGEQERVQAAANAALERGERRFACEYRVRQASGSPRWLLMRAEIRRNDQGEFATVIGVVLDIDERKRAEEAQHLLARELNHRVKNSLAVVQALVRQSFREDVPLAAAVQAFQQRVSALGKANDILIAGDWTGFGLRELIDHITAPYRGTHDPFEIDGPVCRVAPRFNVSLALVMHEMCTNAAKYGALSVSEGRVSISWALDGQNGLKFAWKERDGPPVVQPTRFGFGSTMIQRHLASDFEDVQLAFAGDGISLTLLFPNGAIASVENGPQAA
jgi:PAS domain S-box-containing protein